MKSYVILEPTSMEACKMAFLLTPFIAPAIEQSFGEMEISDVFESILHETEKVWLVCERDSGKLVGVAVTEVTKYPACQRLRVVFLGGSDMDGWRDQLDESFCAFCEEHKLSDIEVVGRKGFTRSLEKLGYCPTYTVLLKSMKEVYCG